MSLLYKKPEDVSTFVDVKVEGTKVQLLFSCDGGKHGTHELLDGFELSAERLLEILQKDEDEQETTNQSIH